VFIDLYQNGMAKASPFLQASLWASITVENPLFLLIENSNADSSPRTGNNALSLLLTRMKL